MGHINVQASADTHSVEKTAYLVSEISVTNFFSLHFLGV